MAKKIAMILGIVFVLVGILGFVQSPILGTFAAGTMHSVVHLLAGLILFCASRSAICPFRSARLYPHPRDVL